LLLFVDTVVMMIGICNYEKKGTRDVESIQQPTTRHHPCTRINQSAKGRSRLVRHNFSRLSTHPPKSLVCLIPLYFIWVPSFLAGLPMPVKGAQTKTNGRHQESGFWGRLPLLLSW